MVNAGEGGTVAGSETGVYCGDERNISAEADEGYVFLHWSDANENIVSVENPLTVMVLSDTVLYANFEEDTISISERILLKTVSIFPNPTTSDFTVSFEVLKSGNMQIILCDILGVELLQFYDGFATVGTFTKTVSTEHLPRGVYFLKVLIDGNYTDDMAVLE